MSPLLDSDGNPVRIKNMPLKNTAGDQAGYNRGFDLKRIIDTLPAGLEREILRIMNFHRGRQNAISRDELVCNLAEMGFHFKDDRKIRACINQLRKSGKPGSWICSTGGESGGYWLAASQEELEEYIRREQESRLKDLAEQARAMRAAAERYWGIYSPEKQIGMF